MTFSPGAVEFKYQYGKVEATCSFGLAFTIEHHPNSTNFSTLEVKSPCCSAKLEGSRFSQSHNCVVCLKFHYDLPPVGISLTSPALPAALEAWVLGYFPPLEAVVVAAALQQKLDRFRSMFNRWSAHECGRLSGELI